MTDLDRTPAPGARRLAGGLPPAVRDALIAEAGSLRFTPPHPRAGGWFATTDLARVDDAVRLLVATAAGNGLGFAPNEASFQRYEPGGHGLPPHRDQRYYVGCIAIATLAGEATFALHAGRGRDQVVEEWTTTPGEVVLLPGWRRGWVDPRPWHRVDPPSGEPRLMFQLRQLAVPDTPAWPGEFTDTERTQAAELAAREPSVRRDGPPRS